jgi:hypothetical protein
MNIGLLSIVSASHSDYHRRRPSKHHYFCTAAKLAAARKKNSVCMLGKEPTMLRRFKKWTHYYSSFFHWCMLAWEMPRASQIFSVSQPRSQSPQSTLGTFRVENSTVIQMKIQTKFVFEFEHGLPRHLVGVCLLFARGLPNCLIKKFNYLWARNSFVAHIVHYGLQWGW